MTDRDRWNSFAFRPGDIVISTPPKCGTTSTQMICALLIFQTTTFDRPLGEISPWLDMQTRDRADVIAPETTSAIWQDNKRFFNRGAGGARPARLGTSEPMPRAPSARPARGSLAAFTQFTEIP